MALCFSNDLSIQETLYFKFERHFYVEINVTVIPTNSVKTHFYLFCFFVETKICSPGHNILELFNNLVQARIVTSTATLDIQYCKLNTRVASRVAERLRILGNQEILEKCQIWVPIQPSTQYSFQILNFDNSCQKTRKIRHQFFVVLSSFTEFFWTLFQTLSGIVELDFQQVCGLLTKTISVFRLGRVKHYFKGMQNSIEFLHIFCSYWNSKFLPCLNFTVVIHMVFKLIYFILILYEALLYYFYVLNLRINAFSVNSRPEKI